MRIVGLRVINVEGALCQRARRSNGRLAVRVRDFCTQERVETVDGGDDIGDIDDARARE